MKYNSIISKLEAALRGANLVELTYVDKAGNQSKRKVEPYKLNTTKGEIHAFCLEKQEIRLFKLKQIMSLEVKNETYNPRWERYIDDVPVGNKEDEATVERDSIQATLQSYPDEKLIELAATFCVPPYDDDLSMRNFRKAIALELERRSTQ